MHVRRPRFPLRVLIAAAFAVACPAGAWAAERLIDGPPHDRIILNDEAKTEVKVQQLDLPDRQLPESPPPESKLTVRMLESPDQKYEVEWRNVARVLLFEQLVLDEAAKLLTEGQYDAAYANYAFLQKSYPKTPGLETAYRTFLFEDAKNLARLGRFEAALAPLIELHRRDPQYERLESAVANVLGRLADQRIAEGKSASAQALLNRLAEMYPQNKQLESRRQKITDEASRLVAAARDHAAADRWREAAAAIDRAVAILPTVPGGQELRAEARRKYPRIVVGVTSPWTGALSGRPDDWAAVRCARLVARPLLEPSFSAVEGLRYGSPLGKLSQSRPEAAGDARGRIVFQIELRPNVGPSADDLADLLSSRSRAGSELTPHLAGAKVAGSNQLKIELWTGAPRPEAILARAWLPLDGAADPRLLTGPYSWETNAPPHAADDEERRFLARANYFAAEPTQAREIVERRYANGAAALRDLRRGDIAVVDRVFPADLPGVKDDEKIKIGTYAVPTVVCLLPNLRHPLLQHRDFRRGLLLALNRAGMLKQIVHGGAEPGSDAVVSGPFPIPAAGDKSPAVYDAAIAARPFDPHLALALVSRNGGATGAAPLVLAHPPHEMARNVCRVIQQQWAVLGVSVELQETPPDGATPSARPGGRKPFDLLYAELQIRDPFVDIEAILGDRGLTGATSGYVAAALARLRTAGGLEAAAERARALHRVTHDETTILPLWQMTERFAYRAELTGVADKPLMLYERVEAWKQE